MRYATLAVLLLLGVFGMTAPVVADINSCVVTVDVTGETPVYETDSIIHVTADVGGTTGNYFYWVKIKIEGNTLVNQRYLGNGASIDRQYSPTSWGIYDAGNEIEFTVTIGTVFDSLVQTIQ